MLQAEQDDLGHHVIHVGRAEGAWEAHLRMRGVADADEIDVGRAVDLSARQEEHVDAALARAIEQLAPAIGEEVLPPAAEQRHVGTPAAALARQQRGGGGDRRGGADRGVARITDQPGDRVGEQLLLAKRFRRRAGHARAGRGRRQTRPRSRPCARIRQDARHRADSVRRARAARRRAARPRPTPRRSRRACRPPAWDRRTGCRREASRR